MAASNVFRLTSTPPPGPPPPPPYDPDISHEPVTAFSAFYMNISHGSMADGSAKLTLGIPASEADQAWLTRATVGYTLRITVEKEIVT
jgi:hypothetical protein